MRRNTFILILFTMIETATGGTIVVAAADPNECAPQSDYRLVCPLEVPDPNAIQGAVLPPAIDGNEPVWSLPAGKYNAVRKACDPDGDLIVSIEIVAATVPATVTISPTRDENGKQDWTLSAELQPGLNLFTVRAVDEHGGESGTRTVTMILWAENRPPVLH